MDGEYPEDIKVYIDGKDITYFIFGANTFSPTVDRRTFYDIDLTGFITSPGIHKIRIVPGFGDGRLDCRVEIA